MHKQIHPFHAALLAGTATLFLGALISDAAYAASYELQWKNFASWLIVGGLLLGGVALLWSLFGLRRIGLRAVRSPVYFLLLLTMWVLGLINSLVHARDAWATMPTGLVLSAIVALLAVGATTIGYSGRRPEAEK